MLGGSVSISIPQQSAGGSNSTCARVLSCAAAATIQLVMATPRMAISRLSALLVMVPAALERTLRWSAIGLAASMGAEGRGSGHNCSAIRCFLISKA